MKILQFLLWILVIYFAIRVIRSIMILRKRSIRHKEGETPFINIQDADFEDVTDKGESGKKDTGSGGKRDADSGSPGN